MDSGKIKKGLLNPREASRYLLQQGGAKVLRWDFDDSGANVLDQDWDTLVIFDCARHDVFAEEIDMDGSLSKVRSRASNTANFVKRNFSGRTAHDLVYLSANPAVGSKREFLDVHKFVGVWHDEARKKRGQENERGLTDPEPVFERARELHAEFPNKRHIVHLLPPHVPHIFKDGEELAPESPYRNYEAVREGDVDRDEMRAVYTENLRHVIEQAKPLIEDLDGKIVLTADHGELLGEGMPKWMKRCHDRWGNQWHKYDYGHYVNVDVRELVTVPWFALPTENRREITAEQPVSDEYDSETIDEKLEALGYKV